MDLIVACVSYGTSILEKRVELELGLSSLVLTERVVTVLDGPRLVSIGATVLLRSGLSQAGQFRQVGSGSLQWE
jgi:hypothetical protein